MTPKPKFTPKEAAWVARFVRRVRRRGICWKQIQRHLNCCRSLLWYILQAHKDVHEHNSPRQAPPRLRLVAPVKDVDGKAMGGLFSKPKAVRPEPVQELPSRNDAAVEQARIGTILANRAQAGRQTNPDTSSLPPVGERSAFFRGGAMTSAPRPAIDLSEITGGLAASIESLCRELLPQGARHGAEWMPCGSIREPLLPSRRAP